MPQHPPSLPLPLSLSLSLPAPLGDAVADLADARGVPVDALVAEAVRRHVEGEAGRVRDEARRLALRHQVLLRRLGE
ncbi:hypothetical protein ACGF1Z_11330 [Streptomyces sp. NPDC048018]|uniref:hypothetical protein n=1 Tax=Streptomyces sp. NPDC048018 TaxID=3365499 RepID=UPI0037146084